MNNPFQGLGEVLQYRPGDVLEVEPPNCVTPCALSRHRGPRLAPVANPWGLTGAQCAVMAHVVEGHVNKEIAELLGIAEKTVELHLHNTRKAMGVNKTLMAALAWDRFHRPTTTHPAETAQPLAGTGD